MNIRKLDNVLTYDKLLKDYEVTMHIKNTNRSSENYFDKFSYYLRKNYHRIFKNDLEFERFIKCNFIALPLKKMWESDTYIHTYISDMIAHNFEELHLDLSHMIKLISFYELPQPIIKMYETQFPNLFDINSNDFIIFMKNLIKYQKLPCDMFLRYSHIIKKNKTLSMACIKSKNYQYYYNKIFESNWRLFKEIKQCADKSV